MELMLEQGMYVQGAAILSRNDMSVDTDYIMIKAVNLESYQYRKSDERPTYDR